ncbi:MAG: helix-turn-helix domain-containing protein, partial [Firmicutes bacterium]|nr:helix-turn-helix domain-containing protein [Bacillota bacterium]
MTLGEKISELQRTRQITNYRIAKDLGISQTSIANWKNGKSEPNALYVRALADYFNIPVSELSPGADAAEDGKAFVYAIEHVPTGRIYVGCTKDVNRRIAEHMKQLQNGKHPSKQMQSDFNTYGGEYVYYVLFRAYAAYDAFSMERHFMSLLNTRDPQKGYNSGDVSKDFSLSN